MDKLDIALELIRRAQQERKRLEAYKKEIDKVGYNWQERSRIELRYTPLPRKSVINDSLRMARRILIEEYV